MISCFQNTLKELFAEPSGLQDMPTEPTEVKPAQVKPVVVEPPKPLPPALRRASQEDRPATPKLTSEQMEAALCQAEDETDVAAAKVVRAEQKAELAEFDENIPWDEREADQKREREEEISKVELELAMLEKEVGEGMHKGLMMPYGIIGLVNIVGSMHEGHVTPYGV